MTDWSPRTTRPGDGASCDTHGVDPPIDRATPDDLVALATDVGPAPMQVGAVLLLDAHTDIDPDAALAAIGDRLTSVPRLRQVLLPTRFGGGRPIWVDDADFSPAHHLTHRPCPAPGDERALLQVAAEVVGTPLRRDRPLWRLTVVSGLGAGGVALVVAFHHVLADGIGGLAVLANLVDGAPSGSPSSVSPAPPEASPAASPASPAAASSASTARPASPTTPQASPTASPTSAAAAPPASAAVPEGSPAASTSASSAALPAAPTRPFPQPPPAAGALRRDALRSRARAVGRVGVAAGRVRDAAAQLRVGGGEKPARCSLNQPTGSGRQFAVVRVDVEQLRRRAHEHGATVNDVVLTAVGGALGAVLAARGEHIDELVVSVPMSARTSTTAADLGNDVGVVPVCIPTAGDPAVRLAAVARLTHAAKQTPRGASSAIIGPVFRLLAAVGVFRWFINRQRLVHTFTTNVRGPAEALTFLGARITDVVALTITTGNVTVSFAALSYAGTLAVTIIADVDTCPDITPLHHALSDELGRLGVDVVPSPLVP